MSLIPAPLQRPLAGMPGQWQNMEECNSFTASAGAVISFGQAVMKGTGDEAVIPLTTGNQFLGIAQENIQTNGTPVNGVVTTYAIGDRLGVADMGVIFVRVGAAVVKGNAVWYLPSDGLYYGATGTGRMLLPGCQFDQSAAQNAVAPVKIRVRPGEAAITAA